MTRNTRRTWLVTGAVAVVAALILPKVGWLRGDSTSKGPGATGARGEATMRVRTEVVETEALNDRVVTIGTILANEEVSIRSEISGKIERILFREGVRVKKGDILVKLNDAELQAQLARAGHRQAIAEQEAERQRRLFEQDLVSQENFDNAVHELDIAKAEVQLIQAQIEKTEIKASFDGVVGLRNVSEGGTVSPSTPITTLQDDGPVKIDFTIAERYAGSIRRGDKIRFKVQGVSREFEGKVYAVEPKIDPATRTLRVRAFSPNPDGVLIPGALANVEVVMNAREAVTIPSYALVAELDGHRVFLYKNGKADSRPVEIGARTNERVEITRGVEAGDTLITSAMLQLKPGMAVRTADSD